MTDSEERSKPLIAVVGPCAAGKSSLVNMLKSSGYNARQNAQEHSYVADMWELITKPDLLIYLDASFEVCTERKELDWTPHEYQDQVERLADARENCDLYIDTDGLSTEDVADTALSYLATME